MNSDLYALIALAARYWFVALIVVLLFRGWRMTVADNRRAKLLREWMGQTGCVGELIANPGAKKRVSYPIPREGVLGSGRAADVRIRHRDLKRAHAHFELREGGLLIRPLGKAALSVGGGFSGESVFLQDGDVLTIGKLQLMLVLFDAPVEEEETDEWFEVGPDADEAPEDDSDEWFGERLAARRVQNPEDGGAERYQRPTARRAQNPEDDPDERYQRPTARRARNTEDDPDEWFGERPAARRVQKPDGGDERVRRPRKVPVTLEGHFSEAPAPRRRRKAPAEVELPFEAGPAASGGKKRAAQKPKGTKAKKPMGGNSLDEDTIWRDL